MKHADEVLAQGVIDARLAANRGIDLSEVAIARAREGRAESQPQFHVSAEPFETFAAPAPFDVIVFNEVLYYPPLDSVPALLRKARGLLRNTPESLLLVSMSQNPKAVLIWPLLRAFGHPLVQYRLSSGNSAMGWRIAAYGNRF